jgi:hypothetical protein
MAISINKVRRIADLINLSPVKEPQRSYQWEATIRGGRQFSLLSDIKFFLKTANIPAIAKENMIIDYMDKKLLFAGKDASPHIVTMTFFDDESLTVLRYFHSWMREMGEIGTGISVDKDQYARELLIRLKDTTDFITTGEIILTNSYPVEIGEIPLNYDGSDIIEISVTLSYDEQILNDDYTFNFDLRELLF